MASELDQQRDVRLLHHPEMHRNRVGRERGPSIRHDRGLRARFNARSLRELSDSSRAIASSPS